MTPEHDPEIRAALEGAGASPAPSYGAKARIRRGIEERVAGKRGKGAGARVLLFVLVTCLIGVVVGTRLRPAPVAVLTKGSTLTLQTSRVVLRPEAELVVERDDASGTRLRLLSGTALVHVQKATGRSFEILSGPARVKVVGTVFAVSREAQRGVRVEVLEGIVEIEEGASTRRLAAGESHPPGSDLFGDAAELAALRMPLPPVVVPRGDAAEPAATSQAPGAAPEGRDGGARSYPTTTPVAASRPSAREVTESPFARAKVFERSGDLDAALGAYEALSRGESAQAEDALFAVVRLRAARAEQPAALEAVSQYRSRFAEGRYARDIDVQSLNLRLSAGDDESARAESDRFLKRFPQDPRAWRFRLARAALLARSGDCARALVELKAVPEGDARRRVEEACAAK